MNLRQLLTNVPLLLGIQFLVLAVLLGFTQLGDSPNPLIPRPTVPDEDEEEPEELGEPRAVGPVADVATRDVANLPDIAPRPPVRLDLLIPAVIAVLYFLLSIWRLGNPPEMVFDEVHHARTAMEFVVGQEPHEWSHPHFSKLMAALSLKMTHHGFNPSDEVWKESARYSLATAAAWRFPSAVFGAAALVALYILALSMTRSRLAATLATLFLALDGVFFVHSRIVMTNSYTVFFVLLATLGAWRFAESDRAGSLILCGVGLGGALASRWSSLYVWGLLALLLIADTVRRYPLSTWADHIPALLRRAGLLALCFLVIPAALYLISYVPFVLQGDKGTAFDKLFHWDYNQHGWKRVFMLQKEMWDYHSKLKAEHTYNSPWWSWPLMLRPVWYYFKSDDNHIRAIWAIGNAAIWWAALPTFLVTIPYALRLRKEKLGRALIWTLVMGVGQWLLWGAKSRSLNFMHYFLESIPFVCIALAVVLVGLYESGFDTKGKPIDSTMAYASRALAVCWVLAVIAWFIFYFPLLTAYPISEKYYQLHLWMGNRWI